MRYSSCLFRNQTSISRLSVWYKEDTQQGLLAKACCSECQAALALYDRIKSLIIRLLCVILHSLRHDLIPVLGLASAA